MEKKKVAWIGTGVMGSQQAGHLAKHGYTVSAYTHRYEKLLELQQQFGIIPCKTIAEAVQDADSATSKRCSATGAASSTAPNRAHLPST